MSTLTKLGVEARPITLEQPGYPTTLIKVVIETPHPLGRVHLSADQTLYMHSRLTQLAAMFLHGNTTGAKHTVPANLTYRDEEPSVRLGSYGAEAWPVIGDDVWGLPELEAILIESIHPDGHGVLRLSPEQTLHIRDQLERIGFVYFHENIWGGEDARRQ